MSKKITLPASLFIESEVDHPETELRFRLISEDRNRISAWTPIFSVDPEFVFVRGLDNIKGKIDVRKNVGVVSVSWDSIGVYKYFDSSSTYIGISPVYDIWIRWAGVSGANPSNWIYQERIVATSTNIVIPPTYTNPNPPYQDILPKYLYIEVYRQGRTVSRHEDVKSFLQNPNTIDLSNDSIFFESGHKYSTGSPVVYSSTTPIAGLTNGNTYYVSTINYKTLGLCLTEADAFNNNKINLSGTLTGTGSITGYPFRMYSDLITTL